MPPNWAELVAFVALVAVVAVVAFPDNAPANVGAVTVLANVAVPAAAMVKRATPPVLSSRLVEGELASMNPVP